MLAKLKEARIASAMTERILFVRVMEHLLCGAILRRILRVPASGRPDYLAWLQSSFRSILRASTVRIAGKASPFGSVSDFCTMRISLLSSS